MKITASKGAHVMRRDSSDVALFTIAFTHSDSNSEVSMINSDKYLQNLNNFSSVSGLT